MQSQPPSKSPSEIVAKFTEAKQHLQLQEAKRQFEQLNQELKLRRQEILGKQRRPSVSVNKAEKFKTMDEHRITLNELEQKLETDLVNGLTSDEGQARIISCGYNQLQEKIRVPWYVKLFHELTSVFALMLWIASLLCFILYGISHDSSNLYLGIVLSLVVSVTGTMTFLQNQKSEEMMQAFKNFIPPETLVIRQGKQNKIQAIHLVPGDIVIIESGKRIPADIRMIQVNGMKVDNSSLTGESQILMRSVECTNPDNPLETKNMIFFGTFCKEGHGKGVVINTGENTVIGQIAGLVNQADEQETPLRQEINNFIRKIAIIAFLVGGIFLVFGLVDGYDALTSILFCTGIIIGYVPCGILATVTVALSLTAKKLAAKKVLVKNLEGVETLGSTSCICSDKTGTLTQNKMTVENLWFDGLKFRGHNSQKFGPNYKYEYDVNQTGFKILQECAIQCSDAMFDTHIPQERIVKITQDKSLNEVQKIKRIEQATKDWDENLKTIPWLERPTIGDASETALIKFFQPIVDVVEQRNKLQKLCKMPFNSQNKYAFSIVEQKIDDSLYCIYTKGAPERIWKLCEYVLVDGIPQLKDAYWEQQFMKINQQFGKNGERVLGFAKLHLPKSQYPRGFQFNVDDYNFPFAKQQFVGLISLIDPPKDAVPNAVIRCKTAGIKVIMVTGDQPVTALAIAKQCNIVTEKTVNEYQEEQNISFEDAFNKSNAIVIHGDQLTRMMIDDEGKPESEKGRQLSEWLDKQQIVFARTSPAQKLIIVEGCQKKGHIVAVTGDGVNDSPAIKRADIGISMGITGSDVAKDAADMILLNDDFSNIVIGIEEGRKIFDNLKKTIIFCLCGNIGEVLPYLSMVALRIPLPITTVLILFIDLGIGIVTGTAFVYEDVELDIMTRRPRSKEEHLVTPKLLYYSYCVNGVIQFIGCLFCYFVIMNDYGFTPKELFGMNFSSGVIPSINDQYDPLDPFFGNTNLRNIYYQRIAQNPSSVYQYCQSQDLNYAEKIDWLYSTNNKVDLRMMLLACSNGKWQQAVEWGECNVDHVSPISQRPVCYTTEALQHAQTGYYFAMIVSQICNYFALRTNKTTMLYQRLGNWFMFFSFFTLLVIMMCLAFIYPINIALQTRDLVFQHFGLAVFPFSLYMILFNEFRKLMTRVVPQSKGLPSWWSRCMLF